MAGTAIVLSGGGAKGDFEVGALRFLYDSGVRPDIVCGTSVGAINAVKLAEGEDPAAPTQGLSGLEEIWGSLRTNSDMYMEEPWLNDPKLDPRMREYLTGRRADMGISGPTSITPGGGWGDLQFVPNVVAGAANLISSLSFLFGDGTKLLESLNVIKEAQALYNLAPIRARLGSNLDPAKVAAWAAAGSKLRLALVSLETGRLRYVTETGQLLERDGTEVQVRADLPAEYFQVESELQGRMEAIDRLSTEMAEASPASKPNLVKQIKELTAATEPLRERLFELLTQRPLVPSVVDLTSAVMGSAAVPVVFVPESIAGETYVDGGVREILPLKVAIDLGADTVYAIQASAPGIPQTTTFAKAKMGDLAARTLALFLDEIGRDDEASPPGAASVILISPDFDLHDMTVVDPGLVQIARDYGYMRASDAANGVDSESERWKLSTDIARARRRIWALENDRWGQEDPSRPTVPAPPPDAGLQQDLDESKAALSNLIERRRVVGGALPAGIEQWALRLELHRWSAESNDAEFVSQTVPDLVEAGTSAQASITMRNTGVSTWTIAKNYRLGSQDPQDNTIWGVLRVELPESVAPGDQVTFVSTLTAPNVEGIYLFRWQMLREGVEWFGDITFDNIEVHPAGEPSECAAIRQTISGLESDIAELQAELAAAPTGEKGPIRARMREKERALAAAFKHGQQLACTGF